MCRGAAAITLGAVAEALVERDAFCVRLTSTNLGVAARCSTGEAAALQVSAGALVAHRWRVGREHCVGHGCRVHRRSIGPGVDRDGARRAGRECDGGEEREASQGGGTERIHERAPNCVEGHAPRLGKPEATQIPLRFRQPRPDLARTVHPCTSAPSDRIRTAYDSAHRAPEPPPLAHWPFGTLDSLACSSANPLSGAGLRSFASPSLL